MDLGRVPVLNLVIFALLILVQSTSGIQLVAVLSRHGIKGNVTFEQSTPGSDVTVGVHLTHVGTDAPPPEPLEFAIYSNPVDYSTKDICRGLGDDLLVDLAKYLGSKSLFDSPTFTISPTSEPNIEILGESGTIWGRSVRVTTKTGPKVDACGSIHADHLKDSIAGHDDEGAVTGIKTEVVRARFRHPLGGSVWFRAVDFGVPGAATHTLIYSDLYDVSNAGADATRKYPWALYATEPRFAREDDAAGDNCKNLLNVFDPEGKTARSSSCSKDKPEECALGELHARHGELEIGNLHARFSKKQAVDAKLALPELGARVLYLVIRDPVDSKGFFACAKLTPSPARNVTAEFNSKGVLGSIAVVQHSPFEPSKLIPQLWGLDSQAGGFHVHEYPVPPPMSKFSKVCGETGGHFNPFKVDFPKSPSAGTGTHDEYELGDLSGKHGLLINVDNVNGSEWDTMLPLWGPQSVSGRSIVVHKHPDKSRWVCATLVDSRPMIRAVVMFKYPFVGTVEFRQAEEDPDSETTIFIDSLVYADLQTVEDTGDHKWHAHVKPPDSFQDSINWQKRCTSAGGHYNPFQIPVNESSYENCSPESPEYCEVGDLAKRLGTLKIVHDKARRNITRFFFTDTYLPLSGRHSVLDRSIVIHAEEHLNRGNRLACAKILKTFRHKGVVKAWGTDDDPDRRAIGGSIEFTQDARYDATNVKVDFSSLLKLAGGYHVHVASVEIENRFPCQTTGPHWNPFQVPSTASQTPPGSLATIDKFEIGDLNGKHGKLDNLESLRTTYSDWNLPMYGNTSIMGRSVVVHKLEKGARWSCGSIEWGYSPSEATQRSAIASFHHPNGFVRGYIRFRQVIYNNGFESETFIEVNLNHVGENKNKQSHRHNWAIFNSLAGSDAAVKEQTARCSSAGNRWNPTTVDSTKREKYESQCGQDLPFRCEVGDMSGKLGPISIGDGRQVLSDPHYPLSGKDNGMLVKSVVIYDENGSALKFACARVEPDDDVIRTVSMQKSASYSQSQFMREVREILGAPDWLVVSDVGKSKDLHNGECEQLTLRFMGPKANQLSDDFAKLLASGSLPTPTMAVPGLASSSKRNLSYKPCRQTGPQGAARQENNAGVPLRLATASVSIAGSVAVILAARVALPAYLLG